MRQGEGMAQGECDIILAEMRPPPPPASSAMTVTVANSTTMPAVNPPAVPDGTVPTGIINVEVAEVFHI
jgi:hypothetical protein